MRKFVALGVVAIMVSPAMASFYVAGSFNGWDPPNGALMTEVVPGSLWQATITGPTGNQEFKVTDGTWTNAWPPNNMQADFGVGVPLTINYRPGPFTDGWVPNINRVGYNDPGLHGWEIMGGFNGWSSPVVTLSNLGGGLYWGQYTVATPGTNYFKFRKINDWGVSIGNLAFGGDMDVTTTVANETISFKLDLPNGRIAVPEPASLALLALGGLAMLRRR